MIDFKNASIIKLHEDRNGKHNSVIEPMLVQGEEIVSCYQSIRDYVVFTNKRLITVNVQGVTGKKKDYTSLPYNRIQAFSVETAGLLELDSELELWFSGLGKVRLEFLCNTDVSAICKLIAGELL